GIPIERQDLEQIVRRENEDGGAIGKATQRDGDELGSDREGGRPKAPESKRFQRGDYQDVMRLQADGDGGEETDRGCLPAANLLPLEPSRRQRHIRHDEDCQKMLALAKGKQGWN